MISDATDNVPANNMVFKRIKENVEMKKYFMIAEFFTSIR